MRMKTIDIPANPAQMGMPETSRTNALPNKRKASKYSLISKIPFIEFRVTTTGWNQSRIFLYLLIRAW